MLRRLPVLESLDLSHNEFGDNGFIFDDNMMLRSDSLLSLDMSNSDIHVPADIFPGSFSSLRSINLGGNPISVFSDGSLEFLTGIFS